MEVVNRMKFNPNFYTNPQNTNFNSCQTQEYGQGYQTPYMQGMDNNTTPMPLPGSTNEQALYPLESSTAYPQFNTPMAQSNQPIATYKTGGRIKRKKAASLRSLMQNAQQKGRNGDSMLAHISPMEAAMLKNAGGSGTINPKTGLPEFFFRGIRNFFKNPGKTIKKTIKNPKRTIADLISTAAIAAGAMTGNPYIAAGGGGLRSAMRGDKENPLLGAMKAAGYSTGLNSIGNMAGSSYVAPSMSWTKPFSISGPMGATSSGPMGAGSAGGVGARAHTLSKTPGRMSGVSAGDSTISEGSSLTAAEKQSLANDFYRDSEKEAFIKSLTHKPTFLEKAKDSLTDPATLISLGGLGLNAYSTFKKQPKQHEKSPEQLGAEHKRIMAAKRLTPGEIQERNAYYDQIDRKPNLNTAMRPSVPTNRRQHSPDEFAKSGRWFSYYDNPETYKDGGKVNHLAMAMKPKLMLEEIDIRSPRGGMYLHGNTGGQDDKIPARLSDGEFVIDASTVSDLGDGNNNAGARILERLQKNVRKHKRGGKIGLPPKAKNLKDYMR